MDEQHPAEDRADVASDLVFGGVVTSERIEETRQWMRSPSNFDYEPHAVILLAALEAAEARIAAVESDRQRDAYEAGERAYAAERRAEVAERRHAELVEMHHGAEDALAVREATIARVETLVKGRPGNVEVFVDEIAEALRPGSVTSGCGVPVPAEEPEEHAHVYLDEMTECGCAPVATPEETE